MLPKLTDAVTGVLSRCKIHSSTEEFETVINADKESDHSSLIDIYLLARELDIFRLPGQVRKTQPTLTSHCNGLHGVRSMHMGFVLGIWS